MDVKKLKAELERDEGKKFMPYKDTVGKLTIGVGRNLSDVGISQEEVDHLLTNDIQGVINLLDHYMPWWKNLDETRQRVLANMCFNLGINSLMGFHETLKAVQTGHYEIAAQNMLNSKWAGQVGQRAVRLADMMKTGEA